MQSEVAFSHITFLYLNKLTGGGDFAQHMVYYNNPIIYTMHTITFKLMPSLKLKKVWPTTRKGKTILPFNP